MRSIPRVVVMTAVVLTAELLGIASAGGTAAPQVQGPNFIAAGPEGNMWFTEQVGNRIGRITPSGVVTEFSTGLSPASFPLGIALGPDGNMWFAEPGDCTTGTCIGGNRIGRITPAGVITEFSAGLSPDSHPGGIAAGSDGNVWFTELGHCEETCVGGNRIGRITPSGVITEFSTGLSPAAYLGLIARAPDGNMWFTEYAGNRIGRITPSGVITEFSTGLSPNSHPVGIAAGSDGNLWFSQTGLCDEGCSGGGVGRITPAGVITEFSKGITPGGSPFDIAAGPDGNMWFTEQGGDRIGQITPAGLVTEFSAGLSSGSGPYGIAAGSDGNLWFTELSGNRIGRITPAGVISEFPATAQILRVRQVGMRVAVRLRCPAGAALPCKGTVRLGKTGNGGARRLAPLAAGRSTTVVIPISAKWRRLLVSGRRLNVTLLLLPEAHSMAGALAQPITLRSTSRPRIPAVTG